MDMNDKIEEILNNFDFNKVKRVMEFLDWKWHNVGIPNEYQLICEARRLLEQAYEWKTIISCGGFEADYNDGLPSLKFVVEREEIHE